MRGFGLFLCFVRPSSGAAAPAGFAFLVTDDGDFIVTEDGSRILVEVA